MIPKSHYSQPSYHEFLKTPLLSFILLLLPSFFMASCRDAVDGSGMPPPVEHHPNADIEESNRTRRQEYFEMMHRAAPGVDWRAIERRNSLDAMQRRREALNNPEASRGGATWRELGSHNLSGRIHAAAWSTDEQTLYAGADRGGLWKGDLDGKNWMPMSDNLYGGVHEIGVVPAPGGGPDILITLYTDWWSSGFVNRSTDQGQTWTVPAGLTNLKAAKRILVLDDPNHTIFLLVNMKWQWQVLVSTDRGASFVQSRVLSNGGDIWTPRTGPGPVYLLDGQWIYQTTDGGVTWTKVGNQIPANGMLAVLAGSEYPNLRFNAALRVSGNWELWRSEDTGLTWNKMSDLYSYYDYWQSLVASTVDGNLISYAGTEMFTSRNGGATWKKVNKWEQYYLDPTKYLHADVPGLFVFPLAASSTKERWYIGTDGGLYDTDDQVDSVRNLSLEGLGVSQYYSVFTSRRKPDIILAGSQDQGYQRAVVEGAPPPPPGPWLDFVQLVSGDYGHLTSCNGAHDMVYSVHPLFILAQEGEDDPQILLPWIEFPPGESYPWMPYIQADPLDAESFFFCATKLYRYTRVSGPTWQYVKHSKQNFTPGFLSALAFSPLDPQRVYAATSVGNLYYSNDGGVTWTQSSDTGPKYMQFYGTVLLPSSKDKDVCWAAGSGYSNAPVFRTEDGGVTWQPESNGLPSTLVYCMCEAPDQSGRLFCGSETGAWAYNPFTRAWSDILGADAPITTYWACEAVPSQNIVRFGTYSRGLWDYSLNSPGYFPYGELLGDANILELGNEKTPRVGKPTTFEILGCQPGAPGKLAFAQAPGEFPFLGGTLLLDVKSLATVPFTADSQGNGLLTFRISNDPAHVDAELFFQAFAQDPGMSQGMAMSNGLRAVIGR